MAFVFQDSIIFNLSIRENIAFSRAVTDAISLERSPRPSSTTSSPRCRRASTPWSPSRGSSLSGGQKQRLMLARALALNPRVLLLDDFTARVDPTTARTIHNVHRSYPGVTLLSVTQQIAPVVDYDQIILLMEGELLGIRHPRGAAPDSAQYAQIDDSQRSTSEYEVGHAQ